MGGDLQQLGYDRQSKRGRHFGAHVFLLLHDIKDPPYLFFRETKQNKKRRVAPVAVGWSFATIRTRRIRRKRQIKIKKPFFFSFPSRTFYIVNKRESTSSCTFATRCAELCVYCGTKKEKEKRGLLFSSIYYKRSTSQFQTGRGPGGFSSFSYLSLSTTSFEKRSFRSIL